MLADTDAAIGAYPTIPDLIANWGATQYDAHDLVARVREHCPSGYLVPFVCVDTEGRVIMLKGTSNKFWRAVGGLLRDLRYCKSRQLRIARNARNVAPAYPAGSPYRITIEGLAQVVENLYHPTMGPLTLVIQQLPVLARRAAVHERNYINDLAVKVAA
jgi:hypothetical protein